MTARRSLRPSHRALLRAAYVGLAAVDSALAGSTDPRAARARRVTKSALLPLLAAGNRPPDQPLLVAAQLASAAGDVALLRSGDRALRAGMTAFAVAHGAYLARFAILRQDSAATAPTSTPRGLLGPRARGGAMAAAGVGALAVGWVAGRRDPALRLPTTAYALTLTAMTLTAFDVPADHRTRRLLAGGALAFLFSDSVLAVREFVWPTGPRALESTVMATYTAAQLALAEGTSRLPR